MKRIAALTAIIAVLGAACGGGDNPAIDGDGVEKPGPVPAVEGVKFRETKEGIDVPNVKFTDPGAGGASTTINADVIEATTEPLEQRPPRPLLLLMRSPEEANLVFQKLPPGAQALVLEHRDWVSRSLILFTGGGQPDPNYRVLLKDVGVIQAGKTLQVFAEFKKRKGSSAQVISEPWVLLSVNATFTVNAEQCLLLYPQTSTIQGNCH